MPYWPGVILLCLLACAAPGHAEDAQRAKQNYQLHCMGCHGEDGMGLPGQVPAIRVTLASILSTTAGREYVLRVPGVAQSSLSSRDLAEVLNWITREYSAPVALQRIAPFTAGEVERLRREPLLNVSVTRARLNLQ